MASADAAPVRGMLSLRTKLLYGFGSVAFGVKDNGFQTILLLFYNQVMHVPAHLAGAAIFIALMFDALIDPVVGQFSDNLRTRWGRRHPLMYASALPVAVSYLLLWNPPHWSPTALFFYLVVVAVIVRTFITFYEIPSSALIPELSDDYDQRTSFVSYRVFFAWFGGLGMLVLAYVVFLKPDATYKVGQLNETGYSHYGIAAAVVMFLAILVSARGTHKFIPQFRLPPARRLTVLQYAREMMSTLSNRAFLILMCAILFFNLATGLVFALNIYLTTYLWVLSNTQIALLTFSVFLAVIFAFVIALPLSKRFGKRDAATLLFAVGLTISVLPLTLRLSGLFPENGDPFLVPLLFAFSTISASMTIGSSILIVSMISDIVEDDELRTGRRSEGLFFSGNSFLAKATTGLGLFASGLLLSAVDFPTHATPGKVDPQVMHNFALVYVISIFAIYGLAILILTRYPITRQSHEENLRRLTAEVGEAGTDLPPVV